MAWKIDMADGFDGLAEALYRCEPAFLHNILWEVIIT